MMCLTGQKEVHIASQCRYTECKLQQVMASLVILMVGFFYHEAPFSKFDFHLSVTPGFLTGPGTLEDVADGSWS